MIVRQPSKWHANCPVSCTVRYSRRVAATRTVFGFNIKHEAQTSNIAILPVTTPNNDREAALLRPSRALQERCIERAVPGFPQHETCQRLCPRSSILKLGNRTYPFPHRLQQMKMFWKAENALNTCVRLNARFATCWQSYKLAKHRAALFVAKRAPTHPGGSIAAEFRGFHCELGVGGPPGGLLSGLPGLREEWIDTQP